MRRIGTPWPPRSSAWKTFIRTSESPLRGHPRLDDTRRSRRFGSGSTTAARATTWRFAVHLGAAALAILFLVSTPDHAHAESGLNPCSLGRPWPASGDISPDHPAFLVPAYRLPTGPPSEDLALWETVGDSAPVVVPSSVRWVSLAAIDYALVTPSAPFTVGASVELRGRLCEPVSVLYRVVESVDAEPAPPLRLESRVVGYADGEYFAGFEGEVTLVVEGGGVLEDWTPWMQVDFEIGTARPTAIHVEGRRARTSVALACEGFSGRRTGEYDVLSRLRTLNEPIDEVSGQVSFECAEATFYDVRTHRELGPEEASRLRRRPPGTDAGPVDAVDAGSIDAGTDDATGSDGCAGGCSTDTGSGGLFWLVLLGLACVRRRAHG